MMPMWKYYGGKWRSAPRYPRPIHNTIVEPFAGAAGYSTRYHDRQIILVEKDPLIARLWRYLVRVLPSEIMALPVSIDCVDELKGACEEAKDLVGFWLNTGTSSPCKTRSKWSRARPEHGTFWGLKSRLRIACQVEMIRHWRIVEGDYTSAPAVKSATWFIDPPYFEKGVHYRHGSKDLDFDHLAAWAVGRPGQVIVCEGPGASWLPFMPLFDSKTARSEAGRSIKKTEMIWTKGCLRQARLF